MLDYRNGFNLLFSLLFTLIHSIALIIHPFCFVNPLLPIDSPLVCFRDMYIQLPYTVPLSAFLWTPFSISTIPSLLSCHTPRNTHACLCIILFICMHLICYIVYMCVFLYTFNQILHMRENVICVFMTDLYPKNLSSSIHFLCILFIPFYS